MAQEFKAIITVLDKFSAPLRSMNRQLVALNAPFKGLHGSLIQFGAASGITKLGASAGNALGKFRALGGGVSAVLGPVAALGAAAGAGGFISLAKDAADWGEEMENARIRTGLAVDELARLHHVAEATHIETAVLDKGLVILNKTLAMAAGGKNKDAVALFRKLKIDIGGMGKPAKTAADVLPQLSDAFMRNTNASMRARMGNTLFKKSATDLMPVLVMGSAEIARLSAEYERYYGKASPEMLKAMKDGDDAFDHANAAARGLKLTIGAALIPAVTRLVVPMTNWVVANRPLIAQRLSQWVTNVGDALMRVDWKALGASAASIGRGFATVGRYLGPMGTLIAGLVVVFSPFIAALLSAGVALGQLSVAIIGVVIRLGTLLFASVVGAIGTFVTALGAGFTAMEAFNLVLMMNPIGAVIIGITALAAAAFLIWKYWKPIKGFFKDLWSGIVGFFSWAWVKIKPIVDAIGKAMSGAWSLLKWTPAGLVIRGAQWAGKQAANAITGPSQTTAAPVIQRGGGAGARGANGANGTVHVKVDINGAPQGTRTTAKASSGLSLDTGLRFAHP